MSGFNKWKIKNQGVQDQKPVLKKEPSKGAEKTKNQIEEEMMREMMQIQQEAEMFEFKEP